MFCKKCGAELQDGAEYCTACGAKQVEEPIIEQGVRAESTPLYQQSVVQPVSKAAKILGIIGFVCGICSIVFCWEYFVGLVPAIAGIILCSISKKKGGHKLTKPGLIISIIGAVLNVIIGIVEIVILAAAVNTMIY